jgi:hypothetical protein
VQAAPDHLDGFEAGESVDDIAQEAPKRLLMLLLRPVSRNAAAAGWSGWSASYRSDSTPFERNAAVEVLRDGLVIPADDDGAIGPYPDQADQLWVSLGLVLLILGAGHRSILGCYVAVNDPPSDGRHGGDLSLGRASRRCS